MSYVEKVLQPGEEVLARSRLHWFIYRSALFYALLTVAALVGSRMVPAENGALVLIVAALFALFTLIAFLAAWGRRVTTELAVTNHRVIYKTGFLSRHTIEMNRSKVESVDVQQSVTGRIFGYGTIIVRGTGGSLEPIRNIANPLNFRSQITAVD